MLAADERVHLVGIGGAGMRAIAKVLLEMGCRVSGSDIELNEGTRALAALGAVVYQGHRGEQIKGADRLVVSTAITADNPEVVAARAQGVPIHHRSEILAAILNQREGI
ncbi:MAG TPA: Mur ligase domain-containing protein, partial [Limnochordia bacterium]